MTSEKDRIAYTVIEIIAENCFDGHFTIMKFTGNWRVSFGYQPQCRNDIQKMPVGSSLLDACLNAVLATDLPSPKTRTIN